MPVLDFDAFAAALPAEGALMGVDSGTKTLGLAVSDATRLIASPLETLTRSKLAEDLSRLFSAYDHRRCAGVVIGLPLNLDGTSGPSAQRAKAFASNLRKARDLPVLLWDERWSTSAVQRQMIDADVSRKTRAEIVDAQAASFLLQGALDRLRAHRPAS